MTFPWLDQTTSAVPSPDHTAKQYLQAVAWTVPTIPDPDHTAKRYLQAGAWTCLLYTSPSPRDA